MLASHPAPLLDTVPVQPGPADVVELDSRLRPFSCPTGLHEWCVEAAHDLVPQSGLVG